MVLFKPYRLPGLAEKIFPSALYRLPHKEKRVYLTFDDGPTREITSFVLDQLDRYQAKATFFVIGDKIGRNSSLLQQIRKQGHSVGNHTFHHLDAWKTSVTDYLKDIEQTQKHLEAAVGPAKKIFRPPYGRLTPPAARKIRQAGYQIVLWKILTLDYDKRINPHASLPVLQRKIQSGDIIVFHDSEKAYPQLRILLPALLDFLQKEGYGFEIL